MSTPPPNRSAYRERRINVMLQEDSAPAQPAQPAQAVSAPRPLPADFTSPTWSKPHRNRTVFLISAITALLCAAVVFFLLFRRDSSQVAGVRELQPAHSETQSQPAPVNSPPTPVAATPEGAAASSAVQSALPQKPPAAEGEPIHFRLKRSARVQSFGPLKIRLVSSNPRRGLCQIVISNSNDHPQRTIEINRAMSIKTGDASADLLVNGMTKDSISGFVTPHS